MPQPNINKMLKQVQQMQAEMMKAQEQLKDEEVEASAGGGMVRVTADGRGTVRAVVIDPAVFDGHDAEFLGDLVLAAVAEAQRRAADLLQAEMRKVPTLPFAAG